MIYLASPYSGTARQQEERYREAMACAAAFIAKGERIFSPIVYAHEMALRYDLPKDAIFWQAFNAEMIRFSKLMLVLCLPDWEYSRGVKEEIDTAIELKKPIKYVRLRNGSFRIQSEQ